MGTMILLLLLVMGKLYECHVIYTKEPSRFRVAYEDWKPVRDSPLRHVRYPVYHKSNGYSYIPGKKSIHQIAEQSEKVEVFSPAPPTILGSFSVFGHATVNAREHASHINKKLPRPHLTDFATSETRAKVSNFPIRHQYPSAYPNYHHIDIKRPQYPIDYNEPSYFYEASLRPPPHEPSKTYSHTSLSPTSYYSYEQGQIFHDENYYKPQKAHHNSYRHRPAGYSTQLNDYKTTISPSNYDSTFSYYSNPNSQIDTKYYNENPVGSIPLNMKTDTKLKPVTENNVPEHLSHYGRPFQNSQSYSTVETLKNNLEALVTAFPSSSTVETKVKFSDVAQPFRVSSFENVHISSVKPENNPQVYTEEIFPISVTTIDVPTEVDTQKIKNDYGEFEPNHHVPFKPSPYDHSNHKITSSSYQSYENSPPAFLPTPSTDVSPYLSEPKSELTTISPTINNFQESNSISSNEDKVLEPSEAYTEIYSTVPIETTTKSRPMKSRRPSRPSLSSSTTTTNYNQYWDNDYKYQRRRKPNNKVRSREGSEKNNFIKQKTTTTTTNIPENEEIDTFDYTTEFPEINSPINREKSEYVYNGDKIDQPSTKESIYEKNIPQNAEYDKINTRIEESIATNLSTTASTTSSATQITTSTNIPIEPVNRLKTKYGYRPRFSIKDYREKLNKATSTPVSLHDNEKAKPIRNETEFKFRRTKPTITARTTTESPESTRTSFESKFQKYKPRTVQSRYKTTSSIAAPDAGTITTERTNAFKPSTSRYSPGTGKYYSRYRTSTAPNKEADDSSSTKTTKGTIRPKGVFSAKRQPFPLKSKPTTPKIEENITIEEEELPAFPDTLKTNENEVYSAVITKKMDDSTSTTISIGDEKAIDKDTTGLESLRVADLTSSSTNDFLQPSNFKTEKVASKRPLSKITLPTDNPILPLEAFFQTQQK